MALSPPWTADEQIPCVRSAHRGELRLFAVLRGDATSSLSITISGAPNEHAPRKWHTVDVVSSARTIEVYDGKGDYVTSSRGESCDAECPLPAFSHSISLALDSVSLCLKVPSPRCCVVSCPWSVLRASQLSLQCSCSRFVRGALTRTAVWGQRQEGAMLSLQHLRFNKQQHGGAGATCEHE